jgi:hypothetical protein
LTLQQSDKHKVPKHVQKKTTGKDIGRKVTHFKDMHKTTLDRKNNLLESIANDHSKSKYDENPIPHL